jgi:hypothetical protein
MGPCTGYICIEDVPKTSLGLPWHSAKTTSSSTTPLPPDGLEALSTLFLCRHKNDCQHYQHHFKIASKEQAFHQLDKRANNISVKQGGPASISVHGKTPSKGGDFYWWLYSDSTRRRERALRTKQYIIHSDWCEVFWANDKKDTNTSHKEPISLKKARPEWLYLGFLEVSAGLDHWHDQDDLRAPRTSHHTPKINTRLNPAITKRTPAKNGTKYCDLWLMCFLELEDCSVKCNWHFVQP